MSVIIRLQGLPWSASAMNIRHFFSGLSIPAGGVHIIGGDGGDAFIAFSSDDDARMAMKKNMCCLNDNPIQLFLSSKAEMQSVIDAARSGVPSQAAPSTQPAAPIVATDASSLMGGVSQPGMQQGQNFPPNMAMAGMDMINKPNVPQISGNESDFRSQMPQNQWQGFHGGMGAGDANQSRQNQGVGQRQVMGGFPDGVDYQLPKAGDHPMGNRGYTNPGMGGDNSMDQQTPDMLHGQSNIHNQGQRGNQMTQGQNPMEPQMNQGILPQRSFPQGPMGFGNRNQTGAPRNPDFFNQHQIGGPRPMGINQGENRGAVPANMQVKPPFPQDMPMGRNQPNPLAGRQAAGSDSLPPGMNRPNFPESKGPELDFVNSMPPVSMPGMERPGNQFHGGPAAMRDLDKGRAMGLPWADNTMQSPQKNIGQFSQNLNSDPLREDFRNPNSLNSQDSRDRSLLGPGSMYGLNRRSGMPPEKMEEEPLPSTSYPPDESESSMEPEHDFRMQSRFPKLHGDDKHFPSFSGPEGFLRKGLEMDRGRFLEHNRRFPSENHPERNLPGDLNKLPNTVGPAGSLGFGNNRFPPDVHGALDDQYIGRRPNDSSFHPEENRFNRDKDAFERGRPSDPWERQPGPGNNIEGRQPFQPASHLGDRRDFRSTTESIVGNLREPGRRGPSRWDTAKGDIVSESASPNNKPATNTPGETTVDKDQRKGSVERRNVDSLTKANAMDKPNVTGVKSMNLGVGSIASSPGNIEERNSMERKRETFEGQGMGPRFDERRPGFGDMGRRFEARGADFEKRGPGFEGRGTGMEPGKPGFEDKLSGHGEGRLGFEGRGPRPEYDRPLYEGRDLGQRGPGFDGRDPGFGQRGLGFDGRDPEFGQRGPGFEGRDPGFEQRGPGFDGRDPGFGERGPGFEGRDTGFGQRGIGFDGRDPGFGQRGPGFEGRDAGFEGRKPDFEGRRPGFDERGPGFEGRGRRFEGRGLMFEGRRPDLEEFEERGPGFDGRDPGFERRGPGFEGRGRGRGFDGRGRGFEGRGRGFEGRRPDFEGQRGEMSFENRRRDFERFDDMDIEGRGEAGLKPQDKQEFDRRMQFEERQGRYGFDDDVDRMGAPFEGRRPRFEGQGLSFEGRRVPPFDSMHERDVDGRENSDFDGRDPEMDRNRGAEYGRGGAGMRGRGSDTMRGRGGPMGDISRGRGFLDKPFDRELPSHTPNDANEMEDFDSRIPGRGGPMFDRPFRGRGDPFFRGRGGPPGALGRGRGMDMERFGDASPKDVDARNTGSNPNVPADAQQPKDVPGDAPQNKLSNDETESSQPSDKRRDQRYDSGYRRDVDSRGHRRSYDRDRESSRDRRSDDRRGRDRDERRFEDRSRYRFTRDRYRRSRSRSRDRSRDRDRDRYSSSGKSGSPRRRADTQSRSLCVKNMPLSANYKEVRRFFQPFDIPFDGLKIVNDEKGNRKGIAYVQLRRHDNIQEALKRNGQKMETNVVSVTSCTDEEFSKAIDSFVPMAKKTSTEVSEIKLPTNQGKQKPVNPDKVRYILQLKNLPLTITKQKILDFFKGVIIDNNGQSAYIEFDSSGVATGNGFVELKSDMDYKKGLTFDGSKISDNAVRVLPGKPEEADDLKGKQLDMLQRAALRNATSAKKEGTGAHLIRPGLMGPRPSAPMQPQMPGPNPVRPQGPHQVATSINNPRPQAQPLSQNQQSQQASQASKASSPVKAPSQEDAKKGLDTLCVHIQGLPLLATPQDIRQFFTDSQIALRGINIAHDNRGKPLGEGFVEFKTKADFDKAVKKDKTSLGRHIVAVKPINKKEMLDRLGSSHKASEPSPSKPEEAKKDDNVGQGLLATPVSSNQTDSAQQEGMALGIPPSVPGGPQSQNGAQQQRMPPQGMPRGPPPLGPRGPLPLGGVGPQRMPNPQHPKPLMAGLMPSSEMQPPPVHGNKNIPPGVLNQNWFYVRCQNFPSDISISEILHFFQGFRPLGHSIRLHYSSDGNPTGNAVVGFAHREEAERALGSLSMKRCRQNVVTLYPA